MEHYLKECGLELNGKKSDEITLYFFKNPDGSPRWIWNENNPNPDFLRLYSVSNFRSKIFSFAIHFIFKLKCQKLFFRKNKITAYLNQNHFVAKYFQNNFALFTGTEGPNRKLVLFAQKQFIKIGLNENSSALINKEKMALESLKNDKHITVPQTFKINENIVAFSDLGEQKLRYSTFTTVHGLALSELQKQHKIERKKLNETAIFKECEQQLYKQDGRSQHLIPQYLKEKLKELSRQLSEIEFTFTWAHRDFTPWNCYLGEQQLFLYDFELSHTQLPFGFDALHFEMQQGILVEKLSWNKIKPRLRSAFEILCTTTQNKNDSFEDCLKSYLLINTAYHIKLYGKQIKWHDQIGWLFRTWNDALSDLLSSSTSSRKLLIGDLFDLLQNEQYATIKFPNIEPQKLSETSDIDILVSKSLANFLQNYLSSHSLVNGVNVQSKSNMMSMQLLISNGQVLALDLIWKLKRKAKVFMNVNATIKNSELNEFGIRGLNQDDIQEYLTYFYGLNNSQIPEKYVHYFNKIEKLNAKNLNNKINQLPENKGFSKLKNKFNYVLDSFQNPFNSKGMIITFSGVDGAGKSTIIEHTKNILEKKFRKKVVVIRHRPSVLPILSAITQGKEKAEQNATMTLPRQGNNKNILSSLLRFGYYYFDYLFGQFYVYFKHVMKGEVVLYDRYYFDFINDSKRSNINLPKWFTRAGYTMVLQPDLNFFLYADAKTILARKKELNEQTINELTQDYLNLFSGLDKKSKDRYFPIENINLDNTLEFITSKIKSKIFKNENNH